MIEIPAEPADPDLLPPPLKPFKAVPPLVTEINLSLDDKFLYVSCFGTGDLKQYDVSDPFHPRETGTVRLGGMATRTPRIRRPARSMALRRCSSSAATAAASTSPTRFTRRWDDQFYPEGIRGWVAKIDVNPAGGIALDPKFFIPFDGERPHQIRLEGGDCSSDSFCYP